MDRIHGLSDYERIRETFRWDVPEYFNFGTDVIDRWARESPDRLALQVVSDEGEQTRTFAELARRSDQIASGLLARGLQPGDRVVVVLPRIVEWWEVLAGLLKAGLVALPGTTLLTTKDLVYRLCAAEAAAIITDGDGAAKIDQAGNEVSLKAKILVGQQDCDGWIPFPELLAGDAEAKPGVRTRSDDPALIYFTSGTTGFPKMVVHTQASYGIGHEITGRFWLDLQPGDLHWNISDTGWAKAAWSSFFGPWICGASVFAQNPRGKFAAADMLETLSRYPITSLCAAPTVYRMLVQEDLSQFHPKALRNCVAAGEPLNPEVIEVWQKGTGLTIRDGYGQTETVLLCGNFPGIELRPGSMGRASPGFDLAVIDDDGNRLPPGREGDIAIRVEPERPAGLFREYWRAPEAMTHSFRNGWYTTGDRAYVDEDGYFWFVGRADDVITSAAYRIGPFEVESALLEHAAVAEAAVVGSPDPVRGEVVKAYVVLSAGYTPGDELAAELQEHVKRLTAPYKYPREIEFVAELPKTTSGKIRRVDLRNRERERKRNSGSRP